MGEGAGVPVLGTGLAVATAVACDGTLAVVADPKGQNLDGFGPFVGGAVLDPARSAAEEVVGGDAAAAVEWRGPCMAVGAAGTSSAFGRVSTNLRLKR